MADKENQNEIEGHMTCMQAGLKLVLPRRGALKEVVRSECECSLYKRAAPETK